MSKIEIMGLTIDRVDFQEATLRMEELLKQNIPSRIVTPNTEIVMRAEKRADMLSILNSAELIVPDGIGLIHASKLVGIPLKERVTGFDLSMELLKIAERDGLGLFLLGGAEGVAEEAAKNIRLKYPNLRITGCHHGYFKGRHNGLESDEEAALIQSINTAGTDIIFVGMGYPYQELWAYRNLDRLQVRLLIGNGGVIDVLAGKVQRAPEFFRKFGLEWFYRLLRQPSRIKRQLVLPVFLFRILLHRKKYVREVEK